MCDGLYDGIRELIYDVRSLRTTAASRAALHEYLAVNHPTLPCPGDGFATVEGESIRVVYHLRIGAAAADVLAPELVTYRRDREELAALQHEDDLEGAVRMYRRLRAELVGLQDALIASIEPGLDDAKDKPQ